MIKLETLEIENFGIFKDVKLDFRGKTVVGILAEYAKDPKRSNMSGKSMILEAIRYNLVGTTRYKKETKIIHYGQEVMKVICTYIDDEGKKYKITRGRDIKNNGILELDWIEKTTEAKSAISDIFGVSSDDFDITSFFKQADINGFMDKSPAEKTAYLQKAMDNDHWKDKEAMVKEDIKALTITLKENEAVKKALEESVETDEALKEEVKELENSNKKLKKTIGSNTSRINLAEDEFEAVTKHNWKISEKVSNLKEDIDSSHYTHQKMAKLKTKIKLDKKVLIGLEEEVLDLTYTLEEVVATRTKLKSRYASKVEIINSPDNSGMCPVLNESCDRISLSDKDRKKLDKEIISLKKDIEGIAAEVSEVKDNDATVLAIKDTTALIKSQIARYKDMKVDSVEDIEKEINRLNKSKLPVDQELIDELQGISEELPELQSKYNSNNNKIGVLNHRIEAAQKALLQINDIYDKNEKLVLKMERLKYVAMMFGNSGILADEIENAFEEIQDDINYNLKELDCGLTVSFSPDKELAKKESVCSCGFVYYKNYKKSVCEECGTERRKARKDEISLMILDGNGNEADFEGGSGGQKSIVSFAVRIALTMFKKRQNQCQLNMLFLDEVDSALDSHLAGAITDSITKVLTKKLGYDQILMVSHKDEIKESVPSVIKVTKFSDYSTAKFV